MRTPVTAEDVLTAAAAAVTALAPGGDWSARAGDLAWDCWETVEHVADDLLYYALQLTVPDRRSYLPVEAAARRTGGAENTLRADPAAGADGLFAVLTASAGLLAAVVRTAPPDDRGYHPSGPADAEASAAMGVLETLVHTADVATGLGLPFRPDPALCGRVLARLFPEVDAGDDPWTALRWATGRVALPGRPRRADGWRWSNETLEGVPARHRAAPGVGLVTLVVPDYDDALAFYTGALGFALVEDTPLDGAKRWVVVAPPTGHGTALLLARADGEAQRAHVGDQTGGRVAFFLTTADLDADHARMRAAGVVFEQEPREEPYGRVAVFSDPYGNRWDLLEPR